MIFSRARATRTNTHARTHGFLRRHTSPSVTSYCHTPTDMINTRPSANYTPPLRSERQPMILSPPHISTGGSSVSGRSGPTATAIGHCPAGHQNLASETDRHRDRSDAQDDELVGQWLVWPHLSVSGRFRLTIKRKTDWPPAWPERPIATPVDHMRSTATAIDQSPETLPTLNQFLLNRWFVPA